MSWLTYICPTLPYISYFLWPFRSDPSEYFLQSVWSDLVHCGQGRYFWSLFQFDPARSIPVTALPCPALPCPALPCPALPCPALPCPALPCHALPALPCPALLCPALPCPIRHLLQSDPVRFCPRSFILSPLWSDPVLVFAWARFVRSGPIRFGYFLASVSVRSGSGIFLHLFRSDAVRVFVPHYHWSQVVAPDGSLLYVEVRKFPRWLPTVTWSELVTLVALHFHLKGNITFVCAHTANAAWFFPAIIVVTSNVTQKCQRRISRLFVSGILCFKYALRNMCFMRILIY